MPKDVEPAQLDHPLKQAFGWGEDRVRCDFAQRGKTGLDSFLKFVGYFVDHHGLLGVLIETKVTVTVLLEAITNKYMSYIRNEAQRN